MRNTGCLLFAVVILNFLSQAGLFAQARNFDSLRSRIKTIIDTQPAKIGVAVMDLKTGDTMNIHGGDHFPMQSVFKFPLALAVLHKVDAGEYSLDQSFRINRSELDSDTYSPMLKDIHDGSIRINLKELLSYTIKLSDNNACDILFGLAGGTEKVNDYIHRLGIADISIKATEKQMKDDWQVQFTNWATPYAMALLLDKFFNQNILSEKSRIFLWDLMVSSFQKSRIEGLLPEGTVVAHKSGTSGVNKQGERAAFNDIGIVEMPDGRFFAIVVFISGSGDRNEADSHIIAAIAKEAYDFFLQE